MSIEVSLLTNVINNYINKKFTLDGPTSQLVSIISINAVNILYNTIQKIDNDNFKEFATLINNYKNINYLIFIIICYFILYKTNIKLHIHIIVHKCLLITSILLNKNPHYKRLINYYNNLFIDECSKIDNTPINNKIEDTISYEIDLSDMYDKILLIYKFININPHIFNTNISHKIINYDNNIFYIYTDLLHFNDHIHNVYGTIKTSCNPYKKDNKQHYDIKMILNITKNKTHKDNYLSQIEHYLKTQMKHGNEIQLKYYKVLPKEMITHIFYDNNINNWYTDIKLLKDEFFSEHKYSLFSVMESKNEYHINKSNTWNNLLLHGAPGLGKSSLIYRVATLLKKSIISIDISQYINKKQALYALFLSGVLELPDEETKLTIDNNYIIILEEFDFTISKLLELERLYEYKNLINKSMIKDNNTILDENINKYKDIIQQQIPPKTNSTLDKNKELYYNKYISGKNLSGKPLSGEILYGSNKNEKEFDYNQFITDEIVQDEKLHIKTAKQKKNYDNDICKITMDINNNIKMMNDDNKSDILRLGDLLELFQGPVPIKDRMIIATTNDFDKIKNSLPALIRPGRLTPIKFNYMTWDILNELCIYYFKTKPTCDEFSISIPTSHIMELVHKILSLNKSLNDFITELKSLCT